MKQHDKGLSAWQLTMLALGTVIGGSFFLGSAVAIRAAGPAVIGSFILGGAIVYVILFALSEMTVANPSAGSFRTFAERAYGAGAGFVVGWVYWTGLVLAMSSEATAVSILLGKWLPGVPLLAAGAVVIAIVTVLNLLGADKLSKLESGLAVVKLLAIVAFSVIGILLIGGWLPNTSRVGSGALASEQWLPAGIGGVAGSMLIVIFSYAGFEVIGLAASEAKDPHTVIPRAIRCTVAGLVGLYVVAVAVLLPLIPTDTLTEQTSPLVAALEKWNLGWAGSSMDVVLITAILSTMLAAMFGLGRMLRSLADEGHAPAWLKDTRKVPYRGILFSGLSMLVALGMGALLPQQIYLFLVSAGGFSLLFSYIVILATHYKFRKKRGCPPKGNCQLPLFPYSSWFGLTSSILILLSMPLISGQGSGLIVGVLLVAGFSLIYRVNQRNRKKARPSLGEDANTIDAMALQFETSKEISGDLSKKTAKDKK